jgi:anti-sigma factor RsiW
LSESDLHGWVDRALDGQRAGEVEAWLDADAEARQKVSAWQQQNELIRALHAGVEAEPIPDRLRPDRLLSLRRRPLWQSVAAAILLLGVGAAGGWAAGSRAGHPVAATDDATYGLEAHRVYANEVRHAVEVDASQEQHLVTWLSKRLDHPLLAPDLEPLGLELLGGRLLVNPDGSPAAQLMYQDGSGVRFTIYVTRHLEPGETAFRWAEDKGVGAFYWQEPDMGYAIIGAAPKERLLQISQRIYDQIEAGPGP